MNAQDIKTAGATALLLKADPTAPCILVTGPCSVSIKGGTTFAGAAFAEDTAIEIASGALEVGGDYCICIVDGKIGITRHLSVTPATALGGFHFAPGCNAIARAGGDSVPAINSYSVWDLNFRPTCPDPRGMAFIPPRQCWVDIYLLCAEHLKDGTSKFGQVIADGDDTPMKPDSEDPYESLDYETALAAMKHHGKSLLSFEDFIVAAYGVTEKTAVDKDPKKTGLDAARTSKFGLMQATGNMWQWGHDGDPDDPRASIFGGSWWNGRLAGSRFARVACRWPDYSGGNFGARGRSDHLQPV